MAEDFNALIDQTETRAQALNVEADKAIALLESVDEAIDNLSSTIEESANEAQASFNTLTMTHSQETQGKLAQFEAQLAEITQNIDTQWSQLEEAQLFDQFMEKRAEIIKDGAEKIGEALENGLVAAMTDNYQQAEKTVEQFDKVKEQLEKFV